jgi:hypothetical protein
MYMKWTPQDIKAAIHLSLEKTGHTLTDAEQALESHTLMKQSNIGSAIVAGLKGLGTIAGGVATAGGVAGGLGLYGAYKGNQDSDDKILKKMQERQQYEQAIQSLRASLADHGQGM